MMSHLWPGNVRELQQSVSAAAVLSDSDRITATDLGLQESGTQQESRSTFGSYASLPLTEGRNRLIEDFERFAITSALEAESGNVSAAARRLGIHRQNLQQKMKQLGIRAASSDSEDV
jgi:DNA-binding NtrC family response regulator